MKPLYFCAYHAEQLKASESRALSSWSHVMHRGLSAYAQCRMDAAEIYIESALDIALIRSECVNNGVFESIHVEKPLEHLIDMHLASDNFDKANRVLAKVTSSIPENSTLYSAALDALLVKQVQRVEKCESAFFLHCKTPLKTGVRHH